MTALTNFTSVYNIEKQLDQIVEEELYFLAEEKEEGNDWRKIYFCRGEGRGGKYLGNNNFFLRRR